MAITLQQLKKIAKIDWNEDDEELQICLDSSIEIVEAYTNYSLIEKDVIIHSNGNCIDFFKYPILNIEGADNIEYNINSVSLYSKKGTEIKITLGVSDISVLKQCVYSLATTMYETKEVHTSVLPVDFQLKLNQHRRDNFLST